MSWIRHPKDFGAGVMFAGFGLASMVIGSSYPIGSAARMGPGYFPRALGILLIVLGAILVLKGLRSHGSRIQMGDIRPLGIVLVSVLVFGFTVVQLGIGLATIVLVVMSSTASHEYRWKESVIASIVMAAFVVAVFGYGLKLQLPILPAFMAN